MKKKIYAEKNECKGGGGDWNSLSNRAKLVCTPAMVNCFKQKKSSFQICSLKRACAECFVQNKHFLFYFICIAYFTYYSQFCYFSS